jgi:UPF0271 protein
MILDADAAAERIIAMVRQGAVITASGRRIPTAIESVCVHGDSAHAVATAKNLRTRLEAAGFVIAPFTTT